MTQQQRQTDRKREAILQAAITEFRQNGYEATSMDKIAATAAVSKRTVYNHFPSKEELFSAILMQLWHSTATQEVVTYSAEIAMQSLLEGYLARKMLMLCDPNFLDLSRVAVAATIHTPERASDMVEKLSKNELSIVTWIKAAQKDGKLIAGDPALMADMLLGQIKAIAFWPQVAMGQPILSTEQQQVLIQTTANMFLRYYGK
ncbi:TetR/AcrR family transcriptional regulator [Undibacterium sp. Dicai25W]|uniref:TetR/AcrR family transcriptional regulator n=1 Tax=Undibacterium sp. Dicai25W TaxID=3413034 RepID=UPI003BF0646C